jgi:hypothetical protein
MSNGKGDTPQPLLTDEQYLNYNEYLKEEKPLNDALKEAIIKIIPDGRESGGESAGETYNRAIKHGIMLDMFIPANKKKEYRELEKQYYKNLQLLEEKYKLGIEDIVKGMEITELLKKPKLLLEEFNKLPPSLHELYENITYMKEFTDIYGDPAIRKVSEYRKKAKGGVRKTRGQRKKSRSKSRMIKSRRPSLKY